MAKFKSLYFLIIITYIIALTCNYLLPVRDNLKTLNEQIDPLFKPAGFAYSIWFLIFLLLLIWFFRVRDEPELVEDIGFWLPANFLLNALWIFLFTSGAFFWSLVDMVLILITLIVIYRKIQHTTYRSFLLRFPFSIYLGWISVATIVNLFLTLRVYGIYSILGLSEWFWTLLLLLVVGYFGLYMIVRQQDIAYAFVTLWSYLAILIERGGYPFIPYTCWIMIGILSIFIAWKLVDRLHIGEAGR
ncbi:TspO/MBR family protein [Risungbinella massiliensis]|uniref:tryptophan-rich sensory protein n=1 Tax=Risungbinella massiliensis TaxID=1329796 RepID=UPI0005CC7DB8|nr:tryptophan-rich sensory protein [Risungbinella massiliensis]